MRTADKKAHHVRSLKARRTWLGKQQRRCQVCHNWSCCVFIHHIIGGAGRSHEPCNMLVVCLRCHGIIHDETYRDDDGNAIPKLRLGAVLTCKKETAPDEWNPERLRELRGSNLPDLEPLPEWVLKERAKWERRPA